jgi:hypothetical protein
MKENLRGSGVDSSALVLIQWCFSVWYGVELAISLSLKILKRLGWRYVKEREDRQGEARLISEQASELAMAAWLDLVWRRQRERIWV